MTFRDADSPSSMSPGRIVAAYAQETKHECLRVLRSAGFTIPILLLPVGFYLLLGIAMSGSRAARNGPGDVHVFVSFLIYGVLAPGLLGISSLLSSDRVQRIVEYKRALPAPFGSFVIAKLLMAVALSAGVTVLITALGAALGHVPLTAGQFAAAAGVALCGVVPISAIGLYLATRASPSGASPIAGALLVGMAILAGLFYPLPGLLDKIRPMWPTYHLQQLSLAALGQPVRESSLASIAALIGFAAVFGFLAARRLARPE